MSEPKPAVDLSSLSEDYEIVGEVGGPGDARTYLGTRKGDGAKRKDDQPGVLITVVTPPEGDEGNALSHLAADTKLLARSAHRRLVPVLDGRWIGKDAFAVITKRLTDPSLSKMLATGESFTNPRIAAILREVNGLLEWAREQKIVHRNITADRIYLEPRTDRVHVSFAVASIGRFHHSDADDDARNIARLAMAMLTGSDDPRTYEGESLSQLRPDLPQRLGEATQSLLDEKNQGTASDVAAYLALIGMADPLAIGESERDRIREEIREEQRQERIKLANERAAFEAEMANERAAFAAEMERERDRIARLQETLERTATEERTELQRALLAERAALTARREELERADAARRAEVERVAARDRQQIEKLRAEIKRAGDLEVEKKRQAALEEITDAESVLDDEEYKSLPFVPPEVITLEALEFDEANPVLSREAVDFTPPPEVVAEADTVVEEETVPAHVTMPARKRWMLAGGVAGTLAALGIVAFALGNRPTPVRQPARPVTRTPVAAAHGPATAPASPMPAPPVRPSDSAVAAAGRWMDSVRAVNRLVSGAGSAGASGTTTNAAGTRAAAGASSAPRDTRASLDSLFDFRNNAAPRRDSTVRRDSVVRPDTTNP